MGRIETKSESLPFARNRVLLAPLAGVTDVSFRRLCAAQGAGLTYTEMVSAKGIKYGSKRTRELLAVSEEEGKGTHNDILVELSKKILDSNFRNRIENSSSIEEIVKLINE